MNKFDWLNKLTEKELSDYLKKEYPVKEIPFFTDQKILKMINNREKVIEERRKKIKNFIYKLSFASSIGLIIIALMTFLIGKFLFKNNLNTCIVSSIIGESYQIIPPFDKKEKLKINANIYPKSTLTTEDKSTVDLQIGKNSKAVINENTEMTFNKLFKDKNIEKSELFLNFGKSFFDINMPEKKLSIFNVKSYALEVIIKGTKFSFTVGRDKTAYVEVIEGKVNIKLNINAKNKIIKNYDKKLYSLINDEINSLIILNTNESISVSLSQLDEIDQEIIKILKSIEDEIKMAKESKLKPVEIYKISEQKIKEIKLIKNNLINKQLSINIKPNEIKNIKPEIEKDKELFSIEKSKVTPDISLNEKGTYITSSDGRIFIASELNNSLFCINPKDGKILWLLKEKIKDITSSAYYFKDKIILATPDNIIVLDNNGKIITSTDVKNGTKYWANPVEIDNKLYIPTSQEVYIFDGSSLSLMEKSPQFLGQSYLYGYSGFLYYLDSNEQKIKSFDLNEKKTTWESQKIENRIFMSPVIYDNNIYISDIKQKLYKFNLNSDKPVKALNLGTGNLTNIVYSNKKLYFIAIDGWLYEVDAANMILFKKIVKADNITGTDKYLTKKILFHNNEIYFSSDTGKLFYYDIKNDNYEFIELNNTENNPLVGTPVIIDGVIYTFDIKGNIYKIKKNI